MANTEDIGELEWERHKPTWGAIPEARHGHFAFVHDKKMYIVGGIIEGATSGSHSYIKLPYLDLSTSSRICFTIA